MAENNPKSPVAEREERTLAFWQKEGIFAKSLNKKSPKGEYVFYDGPPFATGLPHYGHILASAIKDAIPRYQTMRGYHVERRWGWDCHGLPIENIVEKDLKVAGKKQIEALGIETFNEYARSKVLTFVHDWKKTVDRIGRWVDFDGSYKTMDNTYIESVWWALKELYKKDSIYESTRVLPYCPHCETPLAISEIAMDNSYKDITDISVYVKFELEQEPGVYMLAWTTTPWTLPGNFALAVNPDLIYIRVTTDSAEGKKETFIISKTRFEKIKDKFTNPQIISEQKGKELIGNSYKPLFPYFISAPLQNKENAWKVYGGSFVTDTDGTGIVHIAPGYGEDDMNLAKKEHIPFIHHVTTEGKFADIVTDFKGIPVKPKGDHQSADILIIKHLAHAGTLFAKEKIIHPYPHCYRCETPLYYYALPAWFINIQPDKKRLLKLNSEIHWIPDHLKHGRFEKSMEGAPDWNISRNRFWASPLPFWKSQDNTEIEVLGSLEELKEKTSRGNRLFLIRHGEGEHNVHNVLSSNPKNNHALTELGKKQVEQTAALLRKTKVDVMYASDFLRTRQTAEIIADKIGYPKDKIVFDDRLHEIKFGELEGKQVSEYRNLFPGYREAFDTKVPGGESLIDVKKRLGDFAYDIDGKYSKANILVVSHETPLWLLAALVEGLDNTATIELRESDKDFFVNGEMRNVTFAQLPHNKNYELDFHRPYIDEITWTSKSGKLMKRIPEVIDCWFESGSMPFASNHYPFEKKGWLKSHLPADFVAEYIAQTRTWFYYTHVLSTMLFGKIPFKHVVTTGTVLAEDGQKMSKSKGNFTDPWIIFDKYGVDAVRYYLLSSPIMKAEDLNFLEKDVDGLYKKFILRLENVASLYGLYKDAQVIPSRKSPVLLDQWIITRLDEVLMQFTAGFEMYELDRALRPLEQFMDDLSTWYVRRSRDRFKGETNSTDKQYALETTQYVLKTLAQIIAPVMPFIAEDMYQKTKTAEDPESVHLTLWPDVPKKLSKQAEENLNQMSITRRVVTQALEARLKAGIKVRQPLRTLSIRQKLHDEYLALIQDEVNVKQVISDEKLVTDINLDITLDEELKLEGEMRELLRGIQDERKNIGLIPKDRARASIPDNDTNKKILETFRSEITKTASLDEITLGQSPAIVVTKV